MRAGIGRRLPAVIAGIGLAAGGAWGLPLGAAQAAQAAMPKPLAGHRIAGYHPRSAFAASPKHLRGPRPAVPGNTGPGSTGPARPVRMTRVQRAESAAMARARLTGRPVVIGAQTTPTVEVQAHPDGLLSMTSNVFPVRVKVRGTWRAINPTLRRTAGGGWAATTASVPVTFSAGGAGPLVTVADPAGQLVALYWPAVLPRPVISGSVATYRNVLPGVDLRMEATGTGYSEALVVRDAAAATRLRSLSYTVRAWQGAHAAPGPGQLARRRRRQDRQAHLRRRQAADVGFEP